MSTQLRAFNPAFNNTTVNAAVTTSAANLALNPAVNVGVRAIRVVNVGTQVVFIEFTKGTGNASLTTSIPILPNTVEVFTIVNNITTISHIASATGSTIYATYGEGL